MRKLLTIPILLLLLFYQKDANAMSIADIETNIEQLQQDIKDSEKDLAAATGEEEKVATNRELSELKNTLKAYEKAYEMKKEDLQEHTKKLVTGDFESSIVPSEYMRYYKGAAEKYGVDWHVLAAIHDIETNFSQHPTMISSAGAVGHMQFMPATFDAYGVDGDGDGKIDPWNVADAIYSAGNYLSQSGYKKDVRGAIWHYNHAEWYIDKVLNRSNDITAATQTFVQGQGDNQVIQAAKKQIGRTRYVFGGGRNESDIKNGLFDCSSFVHWAFGQAGIDLGNRTSVTTDTLKVVGNQVDPGELQPGDLVFFDTYKVDGHVGIYLGDGKFIGAQDQTGVAIADMSKGYWLEKFNERIVRIHKKS